MFRRLTIFFILSSLVACAKPTDDSEPDSNCGPDYELQLVKFPDLSLRKAQMYSCGSTVFSAGSGYFRVISVDDPTLDFYAYLDYDNTAKVWEP